MTRKKYIKRLMSLGVSRNDAAACADVARLRHGSYVAGMERYWNICRAFYPKLARIYEIENPRFSAFIHKKGMTGGGGA